MSMMQVDRMRRLDEMYAEAIRGECRNGDPESDHREADRLLCEVLSELNLTETVKAFEEVTKWYT